MMPQQSLTYGFFMALVMATVVWMDAMNPRISRIYRWAFPQRPGMATTSS